MSEVYEKTDIHELARGKELSLLLGAGFDKDIFSGKHQPCPLSGCGGKDRFRVSNYKGKIDYICSQCGSGTWIDMLKHQLNTDFLGVLDYVKENIGTIQTMKTPISAQNTDYDRNRLRLDEIKKGCVKITDGDPVDLYLKNRGIGILPSQGVFYNPAVDYFESYLDGEGKKKYKKIGTYPAMVADLMISANERSTLKIVYLTKGGQKADVTEVKRTMPVERQMNGCAVRMFRVTEIMAVSEGIENAVKFTEDTGIPCWSVDNAGNMEKFMPPDSVKSVIIVADSDGNFQGYVSAFTLAKKLKNKGFIVNVVMIIKIAGKYEYHTEAGHKIDYLDYSNGVSK